MITHVIHGIPVTVSRKNVRYIRLRVTAEGSVLATLPRLARFHLLEDFIAAKAEWLQNTRARARLSSPSETITPAQRQELKRRLPQRVSHWAAIVGVPVPEVRLRRMKTRWGSCNIAARRIWLNSQLAAKPPACLDYVIVHELVHFHERTHSPRFYALMTKAMPEWRNVSGSL